MGISLYVMLSGAAPFDQEQPVDRLLREVCSSQGQLGLSGSAWRFISRDAKDVVKGLLQVEPQHRLTMADLREHPWLRDAIHDLESQRLVVPKREEDRALAAATEDVELYEALCFLPQTVATHAALAGIPADFITLLVHNEPADARREQRGRYGEYGDRSAPGQAAA